MASLTHDTAPAKFCVVIHDVTPMFAVEIDRILDALAPWIGDRLGGAVVPEWHGRAASVTERRYFRDWSSRFGEILLHGWTHNREAGRGLVSWCTDGSDEFGGTTLRRTLDRLRTAKDVAEDLVGRSLMGFVPPAWRLAARIAEVHSVGIEYLMRFRELEPFKRPPIPLATWSWDWGWLAGTRLTGAAVGAWRRWFNPRAVPAVVVHPYDVRRRLLPTIVRLIRRFLSSDASPVLPCHLITPLSAELAT